MKIKVLERGKIEKCKKTISITCKVCESKLQIKRRNLRRNINVKFPVPGIGYYEFECPVCKTSNSTTREQEIELGL